jgi:hypothetical protein
MYRARRFHTSGIILSIAMTTFAVTAHAQSEKGTQAEAADTLWGQALEAMNNQDYIGACVKLERVVRLRPDGLGAKLKLAECYERAGRLASAWSTYVLVEPLADRANQAERKKTAHEHVEALKPKLAMLTIVVPDGVRALPGIEVTCDDKVVEASQWGAPLPVDKGRHVIVVTATGMERGERVEVIEADGATSAVTLEQPAKVKPPPEAPVPRKSVAPAVVLGVLAAAGIGSGIGFMVLSGTRKSEALALGSALAAKHGGCVPQWASFDATLCSSIQDKLKADDTFHDIAVGALSAGGAAAAGTVLYLLWPSPRAKTSDQSAARDLRLTPIFGPTGNGLLVSGSF